MIDNQQIPSSRLKPLSIAFFTAAPLESAIVVLRVTGPAEMAGMRVIYGNHGPVVSPEVIYEADLVVIQRDFPRFWKDYQRVIKLASEENKPVIFDLDDLLVKIPLDHSHRSDYAGETLVMLYAILDADMVTASSHYLQEFLVELNPNSMLIHNYLNDRLWICQEQTAGSQQESFVKIGYMGSQTHQADLEDIKQVLINLNQKYPGKLEFKFWGTPPPREILELPTTEFDPIDLADYSQFASYFSQQECDILIAPLVDSEFNKAKSGIKFLEYSVLGAAGVYSKLPPYEAIIDHGVNGYLANSLEDWEKYLSELVEDRTLRNRMGENAKRSVNEHWLLSKNINQFVQVYEMALAGRGTPGKDRQAAENLKSILSHAESYQSDLEDQLFATKNQLSAIHDSRSWKLLVKLQELRLKILPKS